MEPSFELSSDHSPIIAKFHSQIVNQPKPPTLYNKHTDWVLFREELNSSLLQQDVPLKTEYELDEAVQSFQKTFKKQLGKLPQQN